MDGFFVTLVLLVGFGSATYSLGPRKFRTRVSLAMAALLDRIPGLHGLAARMMAAAGRPQSACGDCGSCATDQPANKSFPASHAAPGAVPEVAVPLSQISRRR